MADISCWMSQGKLQVSATGLDSGGHSTSRKIIFYLNGIQKNSKQWTQSDKSDYSTSFSFSPSLGDNNIRVELWYKQGEDWKNSGKYDTLDINKPNSFSEVSIGGTITWSWWNDLIEYINDVRNYRRNMGFSVSGSDLSQLTEARKGTTIMASDWNDLIECYQGISGYGTWLPEATSKKTQITAGLFNQFIGEINTCLNAV